MGNIRQNLRYSGLAQLLQENLSVASGDSSPE